MHLTGRYPLRRNKLPRRRYADCASCHGSLVGMRRTVVGGDVKLLSRRGIRDVAKNTDERDADVVVDRFSLKLPAMGIHGHNERSGPATTVLLSKPL